MEVLLPSALIIDTSLCLKDNTPALTFKIAQDFFENNLNGEESNFVLSDGFYSRTIEQDDLVLAFDTTDDGEFETSREKYRITSEKYFSVITLSYSLATTSNELSLDDSTSIR